MGGDGDFNTLTLLCLDGTPGDQIWTEIARRNNHVGE